MLLCQQLLLLHLIIVRTFLGSQQYFFFFHLNMLSYQLPSTLFFDSTTVILNFPNDTWNFLEANFTVIYPLHCTVKIRAKPDSLYLTLFFFFLKLIVWKCFVLLLGQEIHIFTLDLNMKSAQEMHVLTHNYLIASALY